MKSHTNKLRLIALAVMVATLFPLSASAFDQGEFNRLNQQEKIAFLQGMIAQLEAILETREDGRDNTFSSGDRIVVTGSSGDVITVRPGSSYGSSRVTNVSTSRLIDVDTLSATDIQEDEADLRGEVDLNREDEAIVWFVYGEDDDDLDERSARQRITDSRGEEQRFTINIDDLDDDTRYYFQAVAEDEDGDNRYGDIRTFTTDDNRSGNNNDDEPEVDTESARDIEEDKAELNGTVDMNDFRNGRVFFVYGEDEDQIEDVDSDYDSYNEVDEDGDDLQKVLVDSDLDSSDDYDYTARSLDEDTDYYFVICVEYEDEDNDDVLECGSVRTFTTDDDNGGSNSGDFDLSVSDTSIDEGDRVEVDWEVPSRDESARNWIGLFERGDSNREYISWQYLDDDDNGTVTFRINESGTYEFRLFLDNSYDDEVTSSRVEVD